MQGRVQDIAHERGLAAAGHAGNDGKDAQRELHVNVLKVVLHRPVHRNGILPGPLRPDILLSLAGQVLQGQGTFEFLRGKLLRNTLEHDFTAMDARFRSHVDEKVRRADDFGVMLDHDHGVAYIPEALENLDEPVGVAGMQADGWLVQDVHGPDQGTAKRSHKVHALALTA